MNTQHTSGQWVLNQNNRADMNVRAGEKGFVIAQVTSDGVAHFIGNQSEAEANARLIAAAPELLEALQNCMSWFYLNAKDKKIPLQGVGSPAFLEEEAAA